MMGDSKRTIEPMNKPRFVPCILIPIPTEYGWSGVALYALAVVAVLIVCRVFRNQREVF
jgi:hypothetical protein